MDLDDRIPGSWGVDPVPKRLHVLDGLDTPREREYLRHGGILPYVLRRLLAT